MNKEELNKTEQTFNEKVSGEQDYQKMIGLYERFYNWLLEEIDKEDSRELQALYENALYRMLYKLVSTLSEKRIKCKPLSTEWNSHLVGKVYNLSKERTKAGLAAILDELKQEEDFPTKAYCYQVLQQDGILDFSKMLITEKQIKTVQRPRVGKGFIDDDGSKYWHTGAKELMTYDECTQKGLGHHMLAYPIGHPLQNLSVGFDEPNSDLVKKVENEEVEKWVEEVIS